MASGSFHLISRESRKKEVQDEDTTIHQHCRYVSAGMSVRDMQMVFGFSTPQAIYKWIHGTTMPTVDNLVILAAMFDVTMDDIVAVDSITEKYG